MSNRKIETYIPSRTNFAANVQTSAISTSLVVGSLLALVNHGGNIMAGTLNYGTVLKILLTYAVPYCVALNTSVSAMKAMSVATNSEDEPKIH